MNKNCKKGFTIVELIIVIAVIAILAAVLIPTFSNLIKRANVANDTALVRNLNTALAADGAKQHDTMREALAAANAFGYDVSKINAKADGNEILWDSYNDCFVYKDESGINYIPDSQIKGKAGEGAQLWHIANKGISDISSEYSNYLGEGTYAGTLNVSTGLDVGDHTEVTAVKYTGEGENVIIYMNGGTLTVTETNATAQQYFYGSASQADITTGTSCFHVYGAIAKTNVLAGKVVAENGGMVIVSQAAESASVEKNGGIVLAASGATSLGSNVALSTDAEKAAYVLEISTAAELASFRDRVNAGMTYEGLTIKLTANIDLSSVLDKNYGWKPIGLKITNGPVFKGTFDGQNHTISGLIINGDSFPAEYKENGDNVALFGLIENATLKNFVLRGYVSGKDVAGVVAKGITSSMINITNYVNVNSEEVDTEVGTRGKAAGLAAGFSGIVENCKNYGTIYTSAAQPAAGLVAWDYGKSTYTNCHNYGSVTVGDSATDERAQAAGICANSGDSTSQFIDCSNEGAISAYLAGGVAARASNITIKNFVNKGDITGTLRAGGLVGDAQFKNAGTIAQNCKVENCVIKGVDVGGLFGWLIGGSVDKNCVVTATVETTDNANGFAGKLIGQIEKDVTIAIANPTDNDIGSFRGGTFTFTDKVANNIDFSAVGTEASKIELKNFKQQNGGHAVTIIVGEVTYQYTGSNGQADAYTWKKI